MINGYVHGFTPCHDDDVILLLAGLAKTSAGMQPSKSLTKREKKRKRSKKNGETLFSLEMKANVKQSFWYTICFSSLIIYLYSER